MQGTQGTYLPDKLSAPILACQPTTRLVYNIGETFHIHLGKLRTEITVMLQDSIYSISSRSTTTF
ncbi:GSCOCG00008772001-RA-CDS [Cotesia congregata]|nr:GSCOCG00008772001-RA-CDS [Cotesia congregata]